jgi:hypothetical protein
MCGAPVELRRVGLIEVSANGHAERESFSDFAGESESAGGGYGVEKAASRATEIERG